MCPRTGLDACGKTHPPPGFGSRTVQPVANRYTDYAVPADCHAFCSVNFQLIATFVVSGIGDKIRWVHGRLPMLSLPLHGNERRTCVVLTF